eukprot:CAMPEP_0177651444 /NCGR_PEP_ID=MMETSP0447-20121125/12551_1 /TAXON_ID=0 /ORGANISM="Stygamoeba regulata, Strain BSH-02190019" /LENGTH=268 /DNA_ID=CAMNT_0019154525 /DNA_START=117 /DNA_END=923 /DNA_ORIENTATION=+
MAEGAGGPEPSPIVSANPRRELAALDFNKILGGPLTAVIHAQAASALVTVNFIKEVGFHMTDDEKEEEKKKKKAHHDTLESGDDIHNRDRTKLTEHDPRKKKKDYDPNATSFGKPVNITFEYERKLPSGMSQPVSITVPFLTIIPIPTLRIEEVNVHFLAKITSMKTRDITDRVTQNVATGGVEATSDSSNENRPWQRSLAFSGTVANQKMTKSGYKETRSYSLSVKCRAVNDALPAGMDRILSLLEGAISQVNENPDMAPTALDAPL